MFCHDPELQLVLMPFPVTFSEDTETLTWHLFTLALLLLSEILLVLRHPLVRFWPHLLMHKYHVLSMEYFLDVTLFTPKEKTGFFYGDVHTFNCLDTTRTAPHSADCDLA